MSYLGRKGASAALTSADIPDNSITGAKIVAGTIEASDVAANMATQAELDLKAPITNAALVTPNLGTPSAITLTNATFPAGHVLQTVLVKNGTQAASTGYNLVTAVAGTITLSNASNKIVVSSSTPCVYQTYGGSSNTSGSVYGGFQHVSSGTGVSAETKIWGSWYTGQGLYGFGFSDGDTDEKFLKTVASFVWTFTPGTTNATTITLSAAGYADHTMTVNYQGGSTPYHKESLMVLQEIQV